MGMGVAQVVSGVLVCSASSAGEFIRAGIYGGGGSGRPMAPY